jgi:hypothetical protein
MTFNDQLIEDIAEIFGDTDGPTASATYTPKGAAAISVTLIGMSEAIDLAPKPGDTVTLAGIVWDVASVRSQNAAIAVLSLRRVIDTLKADSGRVREQK